MKYFKIKYYWFIRDFKILFIKREKWYKLIFISKIGQGIGKRFFKSDMF